MTMGKIDLCEIGIVTKDSKAKSKVAFESALGDLTRESYVRDFASPSDFIGKTWKLLTSNKQVGNGERGKYLEYLIAVTLYLEGVAPFYTFAKVPLVPNVEFDLIMYVENRGPIAISIKTSLRERYKQADLEALALKTVFRRAESYLLTLDDHEAGVQQKKLESGDLHALNQILLVTSSDFDKFVEYLKKLRVVSSPNFSFVADPSREVPFHGQQPNLR
jgi:hypothetical protein